MQHRTLRFAGATLVSAALVSTSLSSAAVAGTRHHKSDVLDVTVCKEVKDNNHDRWQKRKSHKDDSFDFKAWTDEETKHFIFDDAVLLSLRQRGLVEPADGLWRVTARGHRALSERNYWWLAHTQASRSLCSSAFSG